jgi:hypothetical protein
MLQTLVILSLSYWIVEEYLNNMYLREYISGVFQTEVWMFGILATLLVFGSATGLFVKHRHGQGTISLEVKNPSPVTIPSKVGTKKTETDFHPLVAALKADMADRRASFGSMIGSGTEQPTKGPADVEVPKASVVDQLTPNRQAPMTGPRLGQTGAPFTQRPLPVLPQQQAGSTVLQTPQPPPPQLPLKITTVITGIMPAAKKKDPAQSPEEKPSSSQ